MAEVVRTIQLSGFDLVGEPAIRVMSDGSLEVWFEFMPPSDSPDDDCENLGQFATFDQEMAKAAGVPVVWEDRELFLIMNAPPGTLKRVQKFIEGYRKRAN